MSSDADNNSTNDSADDSANNTTNDSANDSASNTTGDTTNSSVTLSPAFERVASLQECLDICASSTDCVGTSWRTGPPSHQDYHRCFMSDTDAGYQSDENFQSGVKGGVDQCAFACANQSACKYFSLQKNGLCVGCTVVPSTKFPDAISYALTSRGAVTTAEGQQRSGNGIDAYITDPAHTYYHTHTLSLPIHEPSMSLIHQPSDPDPIPNPTPDSRYLGLLC